MWRERGRAVVVFRAATAEGERASMVFSAVDARTLVEVMEMELMAGVKGKESEDGTIVKKVQGSCTDCVDLFFGVFEPGTEDLKAEVTVLGVETVAAVLLTAIVSG